MSQLTLDTRLIHVGEPKILGAVTLPIFQSVTYLFEDANDYDAVRYARLNNTPNHEALAAKLANLESAEAAVVTASGMAAISTVLLGLLNQGDHILLQDGIYGGTWALVVNEFPRFGIEYDFVDPNSPKEWQEKLRPNTRMLYMETVSNPLMEVADLESASIFARDNGLISVVDNTFASPVNCRPIELGFDLVVHSATKYLNGHSDVVAGAIIGSQVLLDALMPRLNLYGGTLDTHACFLLQRGIKTLSLRVERQNHNAMRLASALSENENVQRVLYPGLASHPRHALARRILHGFGGMLSFEVENAEVAARVCSRLQLGVDAPSLGGVETLVTRPTTTSHKPLSLEARERLGIRDGLIRVSVGIEDADDLIDDFVRALL
jgi:cystathionine beta-lyase/cystathionine gamma-synthase